MLEGSLGTQDATPSTTWAPSRRHGDPPSRLHRRCAWVAPTPGGGPQDEAGDSPARSPPRPAFSCAWRARHSPGPGRTHLPSAAQLPDTRVSAIPDSAAPQKAPPSAKDPRTAVRRRRPALVSQGQRALPGSLQLGASSPVRLTAACWSLQPGQSPACCGLNLGKGPLVGPPAGLPDSCAMPPAPCLPPRPAPAPGQLGGLSPNARLSASVR